MMSEGWTGWFIVPGDLHAPGGRWPYQVEWFNKGVPSGPDSYPASPLPPKIMACGSLEACIAACKLSGVEVRIPKCFTPNGRIDGHGMYSEIANAYEVPKKKPEFVCSFCGKDEYPK